MDQRLFQFPTKGRRWIKANKWSRFTKYQIKCIVLCKAILLFLCSAHRSNVLNRLQLVTWSLAKDCQLWKNNPHYFYFLFSNLTLKVIQTRFNSFFSKGNRDTNNSQNSITIDFSRLFVCLKSTLESDEGSTLLLYLMLHRNPDFRAYLFASSDIDLVCTTQNLGIISRYMSDSFNQWQSLTKINVPWRLRFEQIAFIHNLIGIFSCLAYEWDCQNVFNNFEVIGCI